eukprot:CAMPEP_0204425324 /NCGR_PEP_ID=MMETSP0470-20130426/48815_1 /ASSEMBLY_ACC=CAM_ASM_000385 /TAXON_ID=2969 /ORGANISM="Oxyrrhis marina" /LENGTH=59 /DNA_ID=CAMNT_0051422929 /DNA_START=87 /DNA_END=266 /DNA_ORIENTATION=+
MAKKTTGNVQAKTAVKVLTATHRDLPQQTFVRTRKTCSATSGATMVLSTSHHRVNPVMS